MRNTPHRITTTRLPAATDVLIVGAGPVGLTLATSLATALGAANVVLVEKRAEGVNTSRAAVVHARTLEVLNGIKISDELVRRGVIVPRFTVRDRDRALLTIDFSSLPTEYPYTLMVPQNITEQVLLDRLHALGGRVYGGYEVTGVTQDVTGATVTMATGETVRAAYVVGADGTHSVVRAQAGIGFTGDTYTESFVLADAHLDWPLPDDEVVLYFAPAGLVVVAPLPGGRHRIVATLDAAPEHPSRDDVQSLLDTRGPQRRPARVQDIVWSSRFRLHHRLADRYRAGRIFLAGDAAHVHSPAGGQGMNTGIQDAMVLAARLAAVLRDDGAVTELDGYQAERRPVAAGVVAFTHRMTRLATMPRLPQQKMRNTLLRTLGQIPSVRRTLAMNLSELATDPGRTAAR
jgi:2-polyprenyl-6-methoxyphenol hydroxylase-like FAD-dependent oxidoreductase